MRGDVYRYRDPRNAMSHEQKGERFAVVIQSDLFEALSTLLVAPTSTSARSTWFRPEIELQGKSTRVMVEQTVCIAPERLGEFAGRLSTYELAAVDQALFDLLDLRR
ncbi:type II toxin-antitoxin system PemK/MazF family toxin [Rhizohabitans arisaemae]|uniref:type II toxin-antitoxin system PemK/MazF family toxin n=1 Tax=Rhizohabitans arisaemae TaxID=2720610 RepID=UPI0024B15174|nr:type II toxin-antitoxin system PemK/MazF family toxin [Rhizohabitans arisaemae]